MGGQEGCPPPQCLSCPLLSLCPGVPVLICTQMPHQPLHGHPAGPGHPLPCPRDPGQCSVGLGQLPFLHPGAPDTSHLHAYTLSCVQLFVTLWTVACQTPLSMGFSRQEYCSRLPFSPPGDLPNPGIELASLASLALACGFFTASASWEAPRTWEPSKTQRDQ